MTATIISGGKYASAPHSRADGDQLWLTAEELKMATGWELKPQGFCLDERCIPIPPGREAAFRAGEMLNLTVLAQQAGQPLVHDARHNVWSLGEAVATVNARLRSAERVSRAPMMGSAPIVGPANASYSTPSSISRSSRAPR